LKFKRKALSGLEGRLDIVGLEVMVERVGASTHLEIWKGFQIVGAALVKLWAPNEVQPMGWRAS